MCARTKLCLPRGNKGFEIFFWLSLPKNNWFPTKTIHSFYVKMLLLTGKIAGKAYYIIRLVTFFVLTIDEISAIFPQTWSLVGGQNSPGNELKLFISFCATIFGRRWSRWLYTYLPGSQINLYLQTFSLFITPEFVTLALISAISQYKMLIFSLIKLFSISYLCMIAVSNCCSCFGRVD